MTLGDFRRQTEGLDDNTPLRLVSQPKRHPLEYNVAEVVVLEGDTESDDVIYLLEGGQIGYLPGDIGKSLLLFG